jgi:microcompartment protein CcmL/EutN
MPQNKPITSGFPLRTREDIIASGGDLSVEPSCAPPVSMSGDRKVLGCQAYPICRFSNPHYGSFKGNGPELIAYFEKTIEGNEKTDQIICHGFINSLQAAMDEGIAAAMRNERHEVIKVIAHQGEPFRTMSRTLTIDPKTRERNWSEPKLITRIVGKACDPMESQAFKEYQGALSDEYLGVMPQPSEAQVIMVEEKGK